MTDVDHLLHLGSLHAWLFIPTAILLGALHGLEPGHSKTMMAAFIIAVRGTILQAVLLGLSAAFSHTLIIWVLAAVALKYGGQWNAEMTEPYFQLASAVLIIGLALWMIWRTKKEGDSAAAHKVEDHVHRPQTEFSEEGHHHPGGHGHEHEHEHGESAEYQDAHERMHAEEIQEKFANRSVTTGQVILFGLTGGLMPCPAALSILLICLQLKKVSLGLSLVLAFSLGLAITLVSVGVLAAWSLHHAAKRFSGFGDHVRKLPYLSGALLIFIGLILGYQAWATLH